MSVVFRLFAREETNWLRAKEDGGSVYSCSASKSNFDVTASTLFTFSQWCATVWAISVCAHVYIARTFHRLVSNCVQYNIYIFCEYPDCDWFCCARFHCVCTSSTISVDWNELFLKDPLSEILVSLLHNQSRFIEYNLHFHPLNHSDSIVSNSPMNQMCYQFNQ